MENLTAIENELSFALYQLEIEEARQYFAIENNLIFDIFRSDGKMTEEDKEEYKKQIKYITEAKECILRALAILKY
jgi:hypothetical protein